MLCYSVIRAKTKASDGPQEASGGLETWKTRLREASKRLETLVETLGNKASGSAPRRRQFLAPNTKRKFVLRPSFVLRGSFENLLFSFVKLPNTGLAEWRSRGLGFLCPWQRKLLHGRWAKQLLFGVQLELTGASVLRLGANGRPPKLGPETAPNLRPCGRASPAAGCSRWAPRG